MYARNAERSVSNESVVGSLKNIEINDQEENSKNKSTVFFKKQEQGEELI